MPHCHTCHMLAACWHQSLMCANMNPRYWDTYMHTFIHLYILCISWSIPQEGASPQSSEFLSHASQAALLRHRLTSLAPESLSLLAWRAIHAYFLKVLRLHDCCCCCCCCRWWWWWRYRGSIHTYFLMVCTLLYCALLGSALPCEHGVTHPSSHVRLLPHGLHPSVFACYRLAFMPHLTLRSSGGHLLHDTPFSVLR
jgi:hypothetical protein